MANLIVARDLQTKNFATISEDWLDRFPGEFEKVRDVLDPITEEELDAEKTAIAQAAEARAAEIAASTEPAKTAAPAPAGSASGSSSSTDTSDSSGFTGRAR